MSGSEGGKAEKRKWGKAKKLKGVLGCRLWRGSWFVVLGSSFFYFSFSVFSFSAFSTTRKALGLSLRSWTKAGCRPWSFEAISRPFGVVF
jgi:hypothetical protein